LEFFCFPHSAGKDMTDTLTLKINFDKTPFRWGISERFEGVRASFVKDFATE
jgi:hypothetical protein